MFFYEKSTQKPKSKSLINYIIGAFLLFILIGFVYVILNKDKLQKQLGYKPQQAYENALNNNI